MPRGFGPLVVAVAFAGVLLTGCASTARKPLPPGTLPIASSMVVEVHVGQQALLIESQNTGVGVGARFGLVGFVIGAAVDSSAARRDEARAGSIRDRLVGFDAAALAAQTVQEQVLSAHLASQLYFETFLDSVPMRLSRAALPARDWTLTMDLGYALTHDLRVLRVHLDARYDMRREVRGKRIVSKPLYAIRTEYLVPLPGDSSRLSEDERTTRWAALESDVLASHLDAGFRSVVAMLNYDLSVAGRPVVTGDKAKYALGAMATGSGTRERVIDGRQWIRSGAGGSVLVSVPE